jgi:hypothetical protein
VLANPTHNGAWLFFSHINLLNIQRVSTRMVLGCGSNKMNEQNKETKPSEEDEDEQTAQESTRQNNADSEIDVADGDVFLLLVALVALLENVSVVCNSTRRR